jgi:SET domain-containing protein
MTINNLTVKDSSVHGLGLFSTVNQKEGQVITIISGEHINGDECVRREDEGNVYIFYKSEDEYIDASSHSQLRYLNHSCDYNCDIDEDENGNLVLFAVTDIQAGNELTIDYGYDEIYDYCSCVECDNKIEQMSTAD